MGPSIQVAIGQSRQMPLRILGEVSKPKKVEPWQLASCNDLLDAIHLCIQLSRKKHYAIAEALGIDRGHWTRMMQGGAHFPTRKIGELMRECGNYAPMQFLAREQGYDVYEDPKAKRKAELLSELASIEAEVAA